MLYQSPVGGTCVGQKCRSPGSARRGSVRWVLALSMGGVGRNFFGRNGKWPYPLSCIPWIGEGQAPSEKPRLGSGRSLNKTPTFGTTTTARCGWPRYYTSSGASGLGRCAVLVVVWTLDRKLMVDQKSPYANSSASGSGEANE